MMPQISLYIDEKTLKQVTDFAKSENKSISNWVRTKIESTLKTEWSEEFKALSGSIEDKTFVEPKDIAFSKDNKREKI
ncbi:MAG: DUF6364 family protein [Melioribacteraceae bacterium]